MIETYTLFPTPLKLIKSFLSTEEKQDILKKVKTKHTNLESLNLSHSENIQTILNPVKKKAESYCVTLGEDLFGEKLEWKITSMWMNELSKNGFQYTHNHCNSFISGIIYVNLPEGSPKTKFYRPETLSNFVFANCNKNSNFNIFNSEWTEILETEELDMILFPSYIKHSVDIMNVVGNRITLSFNSVPKKLVNGPYSIEFDV